MLYAASKRVPQGKRFYVEPFKNRVLLTERFESSKKNY